MTEKVARVVAVFEDELSDPAFRHVRAELAAARRQRGAILPNFSDGEALRALGLSAAESVSDEDNYGPPGESLLRFDERSLRALADELSISREQVSAAEEALSAVLDLESTASPATKWEAACLAFAAGKLGPSQQSKRRVGRPTKQAHQKTCVERAKTFDRLIRAAQSNGLVWTDIHLIRLIKRVQKDLRRGQVPLFDVFWDSDEKGIHNSVIQGRALLTGRPNGLLGRTRRARR